MARLILSASALLAALVAGQQEEPSWLPGDFQAWVREHGKRYSDEATWRQALANFKSNEEIIKVLNADPDDDAEYGHTQFSDLTPEAFNRVYFPRRLDPSEGRLGSAPYASVDLQAPPAAVDWRQQNAVTPVKDQKSCGSCWAESAVANIESRWYLARRQTGLQNPVSLSVEQVIECDPHDYACYGGFPKGAYQYAIEHGGLASEADYPYQVDGKTICLANQTYNETCGDGMCDDPPLTNYCDVTCSDSKHKSVATISSWQALPEDEVQMAAHLAVHGPISVGLDASGSLGILLPWLQFYHRGVANPRLCGSKVDHGVLLVGYGQDSGKDYWTIKNSWGVKWGEEGYFRLLRGERKCGIDTLASTAIVDSDATLVV